MLLLFPTDKEQVSRPISQVGTDILVDTQPGRYRADHGEKGGRLFSVIYYFYCYHYCYYQIHEALRRNDPGLVVVDYVIGWLVP